jgi:hypothetical protein
MSDSAGRVTDAPAVVTRLRDAAAAREDARAAVEDVGRERLGALQSALDDAHRLFDRYEERATGTGDFQAYVSFQDDLVDFVEDLPNDLPERAVFEGWLDDFKKRTLSTRDFERAREDLADARDLVDRLEALQDSQDAHRQAVADAKARRSTLRSDIDHLERVLELGEADLDAPVEVLRDPIETANAAIQTAFTEFRRTAPARDVLAVFERAQAFPLVDAPAPPTELRRYLADHAVGEESIARLLELADFSHSKLDHFVDDPAALKRVVGGNRTALDALSADPFTIDWPPARGDVLRRRADELLSATSRFASEDAAAALRTVQQVAREDRFSSLRAAAIARDELSESDRDRLASGAVEADLAAAREALDAVTDALDEYA